MNRRFFLKETILAGSGFILLHGCVNFSEEVDITFTNLKMSKKAILTVEALVSAIIPKTDIPGATEIDVHLFVLKMLDDCYSPTDQVKFVDGILSFNKFTDRNNSKGFSSLTDDDKIQVIQQALSDSTLPEAVTFALLTTRQLTITGFTQSKYVMTELIPYKMTPGKFTGCIKLNNL